MNRTRVMLASLLVAVMFSMAPISLIAEESNVSRDYDQAIKELKVEIQKIKDELARLNKKLEQRKESAERKQKTQQQLTHPDQPTHD